MGREDEGAGSHINGSVSDSFCTSVAGKLNSCSSYRMSIGLGMTREEWLELRSQVDDSFWVMRVIGLLVFSSNIIYL
jgi:hypothetical protein